jgi:hypothetical protein
MLQCQSGMAQVINSPCVVLLVVPNHPMQKIELPMPAKYEKVSLSEPRDMKDSPRRQDY